MFYLILVGIVGLVAVSLLLLSFNAPKEPDRNEIGRSSFRFGVGVCLALLVVFTVLFSMTIVHARNVGIITSFGKESGPVDAQGNHLPKNPGIGWTMPWEAKEEFPTNVQYLVLDNSDKADGTTKVSYKGGGNGEVDSTIRWTLDPTKAVDLWRKYREFNKVTDQLVKASARTSLGVVIGAYPPNEARSGEKRREITDLVTADLNKTLESNGIRVDSVSITDVRLDGKTQGSIEALIKANADLQRATIDQQRATIEAQTAKIRQQSGSLSVGALQRYCLEVTNAWDNSKNGALPATWSCLGGQTAPVIVGQH